MARQALELKLPPPPDFAALEKVTKQLIAATQRGIEAARELTNRSYSVG